MRYFVTGASGWIGSPTTAKLIESGHQVVGLARSDDSAAATAAIGAQPARGSLEDLDLLRDEARKSDGVIHLAFRHDIAFSGDFLGATESDRKAIETFGDALAGSDRPLIVAAGTLGLGRGQVGLESDLPDPAAHPRNANAVTTLALAGRGVRSIVIRFAPTVHGKGDHGFIATLVDIARETGVSGYVDDGANRWSAVHVSDAADLVARAAANAPAASILHATDEAGITTRTIAEAIGAALNLPVRSIPATQAGEHFKFLGGFFGADAPASSRATRALLDWHPTGPSLLADLAAGAYTSE